MVLVVSLLNAICAYHHDIFPIQSCIVHLVFRTVSDQQTTLIHTNSAEQIDGHRNERASERARKEERRYHISQGHTAPSFKFFYFSFQDTHSTVMMPLNNKAEVSNISSPHGIRLLSTWTDDPPVAPSKRTRIWTGTSPWDGMNTDNNNATQHLHPTGR